MGGLTVVVPVFREAGNVAPLVEAVRHTMATRLPDLDWEIIFVDDNSDDGTADAVRAAAIADLRIRLIARVGRRGLSSAVVEGVLCALYPIVVVMDGDLQHDPVYFPELIRPLMEDRADIVSASRFLADASSAGLASAKRARQSLRGNAFVKAAFGIGLTDPLTGFFATRRDTFRAALPRLSTLGFKILIDLISSLPSSPRLAEIPFEFARRQSGESKLDGGVLFDFLLFVLEKKVPGVRLVGPRFVSFAMVGGTGIVVHLAVMSAFMVAFTGSIVGQGISTAQFSIAQFSGAATAMVSNFLLNNATTYRDKRLTGAGMFAGLLIFILLSAIGLMANVGVAASIKHAYTVNWSVAAIAGILVGIVWNFATTRRFVWRD